MRRSFRDAVPEVAESAFVSERAYLIGEVTVGPRSSVWPFVCCRADVGPTVIGVESNVQEFSMLHGATIEDGVTVGHGVIVDYATVESNTLVGMHSTIMRGATVESDCVVAAGSVVLQGQTVPEGHMAYGIPVETRPISDEQRGEIERVHAHYVELSREYLDEGGFE